MLFNKIAIAAIALLAFGLLAVGCGGGSSSEGSIDKATFVKQADAICEQASGKMSADFAAVAQRESEVGRAKTSALVVKEAVIPGLETEVKEIRALGLPSEGKGEVQALLEAMQKTIKKAEADPGAFAVSGEALEAVELAGARYGLSACPITQTSAG